MKELEFISIIKKTLSKSGHIGDDCACLKDLGIVLTQDTLVEDVHFLTKYTTPYLLGYKAITVNLSDIFASGAIPKYFTVSLSLPKNISPVFVEEFYKACEDLSKEFNFEIVGGDITGSDKIFVSACAIGLTKGRNISSRKNAKVGDLIVTTGFHGSSRAGLCLLENGKKQNKITDAHLKPELCPDFSQDISTKIADYAMMDTSDGLMDALFKIAQASNVVLYADFNKIPYDKEIENIAKLANADYKDWILYGGEDYQLVACVSKDEIKKLNSKLFTIIGEVKEKKETHFVEIDFQDRIEKISDLDKTFNHFGG
ncbi:MAG TPA: thiamine-phosphate kinase [Candidatus Gastranaerophilaceae bacterium]|nr:thiamine-phosphate kinase [Candidatus Gastranaerophilaceae bacterium]